MGFGNYMDYYQVSGYIYNIYILYGRFAIVSWYREFAYHAPGPITLCPADRFPRMAGFLKEATVPLFTIIIIEIVQDDRRREIVPVFGSNGIRPQPRKEFRVNNTPPPLPLSLEFFF